MIPYSRRTLFRLKLSTALVGTLFAGRLCAELPGNYTIPIGNVPGTNPVVTATDNGAGLPVAINATDIPPADYENLAIQLRRGNTVLNWGTFNLTDSTDAQASTLTFTSTVGAASVLNRVSAGNPSTILGTITATPDVAVWLVNTSGITVGAGGSFNGAALVLSASDITPADFNNILLPNKPLIGVNTAAPISLTGAGALTASGSIIVVGQEITANKSITSTSGEVALIAARDLTLPISLGSPLAITITKGTNLGTAVNIGAVLSGQSVRIVGAGEGGAIASLLNINAGGLLTATATNGVVVLATQSNVAAGVTISGAAAVDGITVGDALTASGPGGDVVLSATGALSSTGTIIANDIVDAKGATVNLANATATNGALKLSASTGDLTFPGGATYSWGTDLALGAAQDVLLGAALTSPGDVTINAGRDAIGDSITTTAGNIAVTAGRDVKGTGAGRMSLVAGGAGRNVSVTATAGTAFLGPVSATGNIGVTANLIDATPITAGGSISLDQTSGNLTYPGIGGASPGTDLFLRAPGRIDLIGNVSVAGSVTIRAGADATGSNLSSQTSFVDVLATTGLAQFNAVQASTNLTVKTGTGVSLLSGKATSGDVVVDAGASALVGDQTAGKSIAIRAVTDITGGILIAGEDIAAQAGGLATIGSGDAGDDLSINATGAVTLNQGKTNGVGPGVDGRRVDFSGANIAFAAGELAAGVGANIDLLSGSTVTAGTTGTVSARSNARITGTDVRVGTLTTALENVDITATTGDVSGLALGAPATDGRLLTSYARATLTASGADKTIKVNAANGTVQLSVVSAGAGATRPAIDQIRVDAKAIDITAAAATNGNLYLQSTAGEVRLLNGSGGVDATLRAQTSVRVDTLVAQTGNTRVTAIDGDVTGTALVAAPAALNDYRRANLAASGLDKLVEVTATGLAAGAAQLGALSAGTGSTALAADQVTVNARTIDLDSTNAANGNTLLKSTVGDIIIGKNVSGRGGILIDSANDVRISSYLAGPPESGFVRSTAGDVTVKAGKSVYGLAGGAMPIERGYGSVKTTGDLTVTGAGDARINALDAGGTLTINLTAGSLTGRPVGSVGTNIAGGGLFALGAARSVTVLAGAAAGNVVLLNRIEAAQDVTVTANSFAIGQLKSKTGLTTATPATNFYVGALEQTGNLALDFGGAPALLNPLSITTDFELEAGYGATSLAAGQSITATIGHNAQLGRVSAGTSAAIEARGLTATFGAPMTVTATTGFVDLKANTGTLAIDTAVAGTTATFTKLGGSITTPGDELRVTTKLSAATDATILSNTHARLKEVVATAGDLKATATLGDVTGTAGPSTGTSDPAFGRAILTALGANRDVTVKSAGLAQLGTIVAGRNVTVTAGSLAPTNGAVDIASATAINGALLVSARAVAPVVGTIRDGDILLGTGFAGTTATLSNVDRGGTAGDIAVSTSLTAAGDATVDSARDATITRTDAGGPLAGTLAVRALRNADLGALTATEDIAVKAGGFAKVASASAGDDLDILAAGPVDLGRGSATGAGADARRVNFSGVNITFDPGEPSDHAKANIALTSTTGDVTAGATGALSAQRNITIAAATIAAIRRDVTAGAPIIPGGAVIRGDYMVTGGTGVVLGDSVARVQNATGFVKITATTGNVAQGAGLLTITSNSDQTLPVAAEPLTIAAAAGSILLGNTDFVGGSVANRESEISLTADQPGQDVFLGKADGDRVIIVAGRDVRANRNITGGYLLRGADSGFLDPDKQTVDIVSGGNVTLKTVAALGLAHDIDIRAFGTLAADGLDAFVASNPGGSVVARAGGDITIGLVRAREDIAIKSNSGAIALGTNTNPIVEFDVEAGDDIDIQAAAALAITSARTLGTGPDTRSVAFPGAALAAAYAAETPALTGANTQFRAGTIASVTENVVSNNNYSVSGGTGVVLGDALARTQSAKGAVTITAVTGDITQGTGLLTITSNSDQTPLGELLAVSANAGNILLSNTDFVGGSTSARESDVRLTSNGATAFQNIWGDKVVIDAGGNVTASGDVAAGTLARGPDTLPLDPDKQTFDVRSGGNVTLKKVTLFGTGHDIDIKAVGSITATDALFAPRNVTINGQALDLTLATATSGTLLLQSTVGDVKIVGGTAGINATVAAAANARIGSLTATTGDVGVTATAGDVSGLLLGVPATDGRALPLYSRADLLALAADKTVTATATNGSVQLGTVLAGTGASVLAADQVKVDAKSIDIVTATAANGNMALRATSGNLRLVTGAAANGTAIATASGNAVVDSLTAGGSATLGAGGLAKAGLIRSAGSSVAGTGATVDLGTADAKTSLTVTASNGELRLALGSAGTTASLATTGGGATGDVTVSTSLNSGGAATITSVSDARLALVKATTGDVTVKALAGEVTGVGVGAANLEATAGKVTVDAGALARLGIVNASGNIGVTGDMISVGDATAGGGLSLIADVGTITLGNGKSVGSAVVDAKGAASISTLESTGGIATVTAGGAATIGIVKSLNALTVTADSVTISTTATSSAAGFAITGRTGDVALADAKGVTASTVTTGRDALIGNAATTGGSLSVTATRDVSGGSGGRATLSAAGTGGALSVDAKAGLARLGALAANGAMTIKGKTSIDASSAIATGNTAFETDGMATMGAVSATGSMVSVTASNADIGGAISASKIVVVNKSAANALRLGTGAGGTGGFELNEVEINRLNAAEVVLDAGTGAGQTPQDVAIGGLTIDADTGSSRFDILGLKRIDITGTISATGSSATRVIRFGGSANPNDRASIIRVEATATGGGGRILLGATQPGTTNPDPGSANLELRGTKIGVGQSQGFLQTLGLLFGGTPLDSATVSAQFIGNANSTLYNASIGGAPYNPADQVLLSARTLTVRVGDYALIQNTGVTGTSAGTVLGGSVGAPINGALQASGPNPPDAGGFAVFGTINGLTNSTAALLGSTVISITAVDRANTRVNGCLVGSSGGGCLVNVVTQPTLNVFDSSKADIFKSAADFEVPFDPVVGTNNESLFGDVGTFGLENIPLAPQPDCTEPNCPPAMEPKR